MAGAQPDRRVLSRAASAACWAVLGLGAAPAAATWGPRAIVPRCDSDVYEGGATALTHKGIALDDTTLRYCPSKIPGFWPNTQAPLRSLRIVRPYDPTWPVQERWDAWQRLVEFADAGGAKLLVGTPISCQKQEDEQAWRWAKELLRLLGPSRVMGLAIGNELELLRHKANSGQGDVWPSCITDLWEKGRLWRTFTRFVDELDAMDDGFKTVPVTTVFGGEALASTRDPFEEVDGAKVNTFLRDASRRYGHRFAFTFNFYPYFDTGVHLDPGGEGRCEQALSTSTCWRPNCLVANQMRLVRRRIEQLTGRHDDLLWIGESGWSMPRSGTLDTAARNCPAWSSMEAFTDYYRGFLQWDMSLGSSSVRPPDHVFYFTLRDSLNFGMKENFGLIETCESSGCKIRTANFTAYAPPRGRDLGWLKWGFAVVGGAVLAALIGTGVYVNVRDVVGSDSDLLM